MDGPRSNNKSDRNRFVKLAFCWADLLFELDDAHTVVFAAGVTEPLFAVPPEGLIGKSFLDLVPPSERAAVGALLGAIGLDDRIDEERINLGRNVPAVAAGYRAREFDNHFFLALRTTPSFSASDGAILDQAAFSQAASERLHEYLRDGGAGQVTLVRVRNFNDLLSSLGASDRQGLTSAICTVLKAHSLGGRTAGRIGEDSFGYAHAADVDPEAVDREIEERAQPFLPADRSLEAKSLTLDADGAGMTEDQTARALVHTMDQFCSGKIKVAATRLSEALDELMTGTVATVRFIKETTRNKDFDLVYMPVCDLRLGRVHHFEALSRFRDQEKARTTFQIITLAENLGLIVDYDYAVVTKVIDQIGRFFRRTPVPPIAVNISSISIGNPQFLKRLHRLIDEHPGIHRHLMFELTESAEVEDLALANTVIQEFRTRGFTFCLDDFGAGSASFDYLNALEVDIVKFDGPVVRRACASKRGHDLLSTMAKMCAASGVHTVGEMVEDKNMANQLYYCGIDYGQGWHFGKPDPDPFAFEDIFPSRS